MIREMYSHLNGREYLKVRKPGIVRALEQVVTSVDAAACRTKLSKEARKSRKGLLYSPVDMNARFCLHLTRLGWKEDRVSYWVTDNVDLIVETMGMSADQQRGSRYCR